MDLKTTLNTKHVPLALLPREFKLERFFARYEFTSKYLLCCSDAEAIKLSDLIDMADEKCREMWQNLSLGYTEGSGLTILREELANMFPNTNAEDFLLVVPQEGIYIAMKCILHYFTTKSDGRNVHVITTFPGYQSLYENLQCDGALISYWKAQYSSKSGWFFDVDHLRNAITEETRILVVNFPHNPTGWTPNVDEWQDIISLCRENKILLFSDEMYRLSNNDNSDPLPSACSSYENSVTLGGMSKTFALPGLRLGWLHTQNKAIMSSMQMFKDYLTICPSAPSEILALIALRNRAQVIEHTMNIVKSNLNALDNFFQKYPDLFEWHRPQACTTAFLKLKTPLLDMFDGTATGFCTKLVSDTGVLLLPASVYNYDDCYVRLGFGRKNMGNALVALEMYIKQLLTQETESKKSPATQNTMNIDINTEQSLCQENSVPTVLLPSNNKLVRYLTKHHESGAAKLVLCYSDADAIKMSDLIKMADDECQNMWSNMALCYTESNGLSVLRNELSKMFPNTAADEFLLVVPQEGIYLAMKCILQYFNTKSTDAKVRVITTFPAFQSLYENLKSDGALVSYWEAQYSSESGWFFDVQQLRNAITKETRILVVNFPHNPTGWTPTEDEWQSIINLCRENNIFLFSDEMYRFSNNNSSAPLSLVSSSYENSVTLGGMSKAFSLPGLRLGWLHTQNQDIMSSMQMFKDYLTICLPTPSEILALIALRNRTQVIEHSMNIVRSNLNTLDTFFEKYPDLFEWHRPQASAATFVKLKKPFLDMFDGTATGFCNKLVSDTGVLLIPASVYDFDDCYVRLGFGRKNMSDALVALEMYIQQRTKEFAK